MEWGAMCGQGRQEGRRAAGWGASASAAHAPAPLPHHAPPPPSPGLPLPSPLCPHPPSHSSLGSAGAGRSGMPRTQPCRCGQCCAPARHRVHRERRREESGGNSGGGGGGRAHSPAACPKHAHPRCSAPTMSLWEICRWGGGAARRQLGGVGALSGLAGRQCATRRHPPAPTHRGLQDLVHHRPVALRQQRVKVGGHQIDHLLVAGEMKRGEGAVGLGGSGGGSGGAPLLGSAPTPLPRAPG